MVKEQDIGIMLLAVYHLALGVVLLCGGAVIMPGVLGALQNVASPREAIGLGAGFFFSFLLTWGGTILSLPVGWGLMRRKEWARWGALVLAFIGLFALYPILIILFLLRGDVKQAFEPGL